MPETVSGGGTREEYDAAEDPHQMAGQRFIYEVKPDVQETGTSRVSDDGSTGAPGVRGRCLRVVLQIILANASEDVNGASCFFKHALTGHASTSFVSVAAAALFLKHSESQKPVKQSSGTF